MELKVLGKLWHLAREKDLYLGEIVMAFEIQCICSNRNNWNYTQQENAPIYSKKMDR